MLLLLSGQVEWPTKGWGMTEPTGRWYLLSPLSIHVNFASIIIIFEIENLIVMYFLIVLHSARRDDSVEILPFYLMFLYFQQVEYFEKVLKLSGLSDSDVEDWEFSALLVHKVTCGFLCENGYFGNFLLVSDPNVRVWRENAYGRQKIKINYCQVFGIGEPLFFFILLNFL